MQKQEDAVLCNFAIQENKRIIQIIRIMYLKLRTIVLFLTGFFFVFTACNDDNNGDVTPEEDQEEFVSLSSPYLICAGRNPGGVGFDFVYNDETGGANNLDSLTVSDFSEDIYIKTIKAEKTDGTLAGMPYIALENNASAVNYSDVDTNCTGTDAYNTLSSESLKAYVLSQDDTSFTTSGLTAGETGKPLMSEITTQYKKLVIGDKWKTYAKNDIDGDEPVWLISTEEGQLVKMIVTEFPASSAPTTTGYIALEWELLN